MSQLFLVPSRPHETLFLTGNAVLENTSEENACDIPTRNPRIFLCRRNSAPELRWNPLVYRDPSQFLAALLADLPVGGRRIPHGPIAWAVGARSRR
ncbi:MAG: hypothetical protein U1F66_06205 [bacterium]